MRKQICTVLAMLSLLLMTGPRATSAQVPDIIEANIPFDFYVGDTHLPAGKYEIKRANSRADIREIINYDTRKAIFFLIHPTDMKTGPAHGELLFDRVRENSFLTKVFEEGDRYGIQLFLTRHEKELEKMSEVTQQIAVPFNHKA